MNAFDVFVTESSSLPNPPSEEVISKRTVKLEMSNGNPEYSQEMPSADTEPADSTEAE